MVLDFRNVIQRIKAGDSEAFTEFYEMTYNKVYFRAKQCTKNEQDAEDALMQAYVEAYKNIDKLETPEAALTWLYKITFNVAAKMYRNKSSEMETLVTEEGEDIFDLEEATDVSTQPELSADQKSTAEIISECLQELSEEQRMTIVAHYYDGLSVDEMAQAFECSENTVKSRLFQARKKLKTMVEDREKKGGYRIHAITIPTLLLALKLLSDKTTITAFAAENAYAASCDALKIPAGKLSLSGSASQAAGTTATATTAAGSVTGTTATTAAAGATATAGTAGAVAGAAGGIGLVKTLIIVAAVAVGGTAVYGGVRSVQKRNELARELQEAMEMRRETEEDASLTEEDFDATDEVLPETEESLEETEEVAELIDFHTMIGEWTSPTDGVLFWIATPDPEDVANEAGADLTFVISHGPYWYITDLVSMDGNEATFETEYYGSKKITVVDSTHIYVEDSSEVREYVLTNPGYEFYLDQPVYEDSSDEEEFVIGDYDWISEFDAD